METNQTVADGVAAPAPWRRTRPIWLVVLLSIATFGLYPYWWFYATWRELKLEVDDPRMRPVWHALAIALVPIYNYFRFDALMYLIRERALLASVPNSLHPGWCVVVWIITSAYSTASFRLFLRGAQTPIWVDIAVSAVEGALIAWGQSALNSTWRASTPGSARERVHPVEWAVIGVGAILVGLALLSDLI